ncbi:MAG: elongation factor G [Acidimicrobiales bacterium]
MAQVPTEKIRNVALVGHVGSGKTTLLEALLVDAGELARAGRVEDGNTVSDHEPEERAHGMSMFSSVVGFNHGEHRLNVIDTPGYLDFEGEARTALEVADLAVFVVGVTDGVGVQTRTLWDIATRRGLPRLVFLNKLDADRADFDTAYAEVVEAFGEGVTLLQLPIGQGSGVHGIAELETEQAFEYDKAGHSHTEEIPADLADREHAAHDELVESVVMADDDLLEHYLDGEEPTVAALTTTLAHGVADATVFPVLCGSALTGIGVDRLAELICQIGPSPADRPAQTVIAGGVDIEVAPDPGGDPLAFVFKTISDEYVGQVSVVRVLSGTLHANASLVNTTSGTSERLHGILALHGQRQEPLTEAVAGDIVAVPKLSRTRTGDLLAPKDTPVSRAPLDLPEAAYARAVTGRSRSDEDKLGTALQRLCDEDPTLSVERVAATHQTLLRGVGPTQIDVALERIARRFHVEVDTEDERAAYLETITSVSEAEGRYKKQTGGHGQFGVVTLRVEPLDRGGGFEFVDKIVGGAIPRQYIPAVEKGVREMMDDGGVFGLPIVDVRVTCLDGKAHSVDSSEMSFKQAARLAFRAALDQGSPVVLEPMSEVEIDVPSTCQGDVLGDLNGRRGRVHRTESLGTDRHRIVATVPTAELLGYVVDLRSLTAGRGSFHATHATYDVAPERTRSLVTAEG